jgi:hypothetical protein
MANEKTTPITYHPNPGRRPDGKLNLDYVIANINFDGRKSKDKYEIYFEIPKTPEQWKKRGLTTTLTFPDIEVNGEKVADEVLRKSMDHLKVQPNFHKFCIWQKEDAEVKDGRETAGTKKPDFHNLAQDLADNYVYGRRETANTVKVSKEDHQANQVMRKLLAELKAGRITQKQMLTKLQEAGLEEVIA